MTKTSTSINLFKSSAGILLFSLLMMMGSSVKAQLVYNENFSMAGPLPSQTLPFGWTQGKWGAGSDLDNYFERINLGTTPAAAPHSAGAMLCYGAWNITNGEASFVATKPFDMRNNAAGTSFSFWMYRDAMNDNDKIQVYINNAPTPTAATLLNETGSLSNEINRYCNATPSDPCGQWSQYNYNIPGGAPWNGANIYVIIVATSGFGNDIYIDDFSITSWPIAQAYSAGNAGVISQNNSTTAKGATNQQIIQCRITVDGALSPLSYSDMTFNTNGSTNPITDITSASLWFTGGNNIFDPLTAVNLGTVGTPAIHATNFTFPGPWSNLEHGDNYFWITYNINATATSGNFVDAEWINAKIGGTDYLPSPFTFAGSREIDLVYCVPTYSVGTAWAGYQTNDYIHRVTLVGDNVPVPGIGNNQNWITVAAGPLCPPPVPKPCPFQSHPPDYELFAAVSGKTTSLTADGTTIYPISLQVGTYGSGNSIAAWIDFNKDGDFLDAGERIAQSGALGALGIYNTTFTVPVTAVAGKTRMRVREVWINYNINPCNSATYGETEDYTVTIVPDCPGATGWTTWLGFTNDWTDPSNWCPSIPPIPPFPLANVKIPGGPSSAGYTYIRPKIVSGVTARANQLNIEQNDTIYIDAPTGSSLTVNEELRIVGSASTLTINSEKTGKAEVLNGQLTPPGVVNNNNTPFNNSAKSRSFIVITQADMLSQGMMAGDIINTIRIPLQRNSTTPTYQNFQMKYWYTNSGFVFVPGNPALTIPPVAGAPAPTVIRASAPLSVASIPSGNWDTITVALTTPFAWSGTSNQLVIEMSYEGPGTGVQDQPRYTQTTGFRRFLCLISLANVGLYPGSTLLPPTQTTMSTGGPVAAGTPIAVGSIVNLAVGMTVIGPGIAANTIVTAVGPGNFVTLNFATTGALAGARNFGTNVFASSVIEYRPNLIFDYNRPYTLYPITVAKNWENNGSFFPGISRVTFNGTIPQTILGTDSTTFYDLTIQNAAHVTLSADIGVKNELVLQTGRLKLNNRLLTLTNQATTALTRVNGYIQSDNDVIANNVAPFGRLRWDMGSTPGIRVIPFANAANVSIALDYEMLTGNNDVTFATYATTPTNLNIPAPTVTNIYGFNGVTWNSDGSSMVDRYYMINNANAASANITFRYANSERSQFNPLGAAPMSAQRWINSSNLWEFPFVPSQTYFQQAIADRVLVSNFSGFAQNTWWTIVGNNTPLPVTLLDFTATPYKDRVKLHWTTASEINNSHFEVEKTINHEDFSVVGRVDSRGPSTNIQEYQTWDMNPVEGIQYYYLHQYDFDGQTEKFGPVSANFSRDLFDIITTTASSSDKGVTVVFNYNSTEPFSYRIMDVTGRVIVSKDHNKAAPGANVIDIPASLSKGVYHIMLQNSSKTVTRKFFY